MTTITTTVADEAWRPDVVTFNAADVVAEALALETAAVTHAYIGDAQTVRVGFVDDAAADWVAEGATIPEADPSLAEVVVHTKWLGLLVQVSTVQWAQTQTSQQLSTSVQRSIIRAADAAYLAQSDTSPAVGLIHTTGAVIGSTISTDLDALADLLAQLQANYAVPTRIVVDPLGWAQLRKLKTGTDYNSTLLGAGTDDAQPRLFGIPVKVSAGMDDYTGVVIDSTSIAVASSQVEVAVSEHALFASNGILLRAGWRFGWNVVRPERLGVFSIVQPGS